MPSTLDDLALRLLGAIRDLNPFETITVTRGETTLRVVRPDFLGGWDYEAHIQRSGRIGWSLSWCDDEMMSGSAFDVEGVMRDLSEPY